MEKSHLMTSRHRLLLGVCLALSAFIAPLQAIETNASGGNLSTDAMWTALTARMGSLSSQNASLETRLANVLLCESRQRFYAPTSTDPGKDADNCVGGLIPANLGLLTTNLSRSGINCSGEGFTCPGSCACHADDLTAKQACKKMGYHSAGGYQVGGYSSPGDNYIARWDDARGNFVRYRANNGMVNNRRLESLTCYDIVEEGTTP